MFSSRLSLNRFGFWVTGGFALAMILSVPVVSIMFVAAQPSGDVWDHLIDTALLKYIHTTVLLAGAVGLLSLLLGTTTAWLVTMCKFPGLKYFDWLLLLPLAIPSYVTAYAYTDLLEYSGPLQTFLREIFSWESPADYWFPEIRSLGGAILVMAFVLYPYVYLLARTAFLEQSANVLEVSRVLGRGPWGSFFKTSLPTARPAIAIGTSLVLMETLNDYGTVDFFSVPTMTYGLIDVWLGMNNVAGGAQIAASLLVFVLLLIILEKLGRRRQRVYQKESSRFAVLPTYDLKGFSAFLAFCSCALPILIGFVFPVIILARLATIYFETSWNKGFQELVLNSFFLSFLAAVITLMIAIFLGYCRRINKSRMLGAAIKIASLGYAMPGAVLAIGILIPFAAFDNYLDGIFRNWIGISTGLIFSGTLFALIFAYVVRFLTIALGQIESSLEKVSPSMDMVSKTLGYSNRGTLWYHHMPLLKGGVFVALIIVFVDCMKELPATLILRPFNFDTLAIHVYQYASDEMLGEAALGCLFIVLVGLMPVLLLSSMLKKSRSVGM